MEALHDFLQAHPGLDLEPLLAGGNERLRAYFYQARRCCRRASRCARPRLSMLCTQSAAGSARSVMNNLF